MTAEGELLGRLQAALQAADIDVDALVEGAGNEARDEGGATLKRLIAQDLLDRSLASLPGDASGPTPPATRPVSAPPRSPIAAGYPARDEAPDSALTYLFGVVGADATLPTADVPVLPGGTPLRFVEGPGCRALVCDVDPRVFEVLREPGTDGLDVLAEAARAHDAILARFVHAPVLPLRLGTALADDHAVQRRLHHHAERLLAELARVAGQAEWAVIVYPSAASGDAARTDVATSGRGYLEQQRDALNAGDDRWEHQERIATELGGPWPPYHVVALDLAVDPAPVS